MVYGESITINGNEYFCLFGALAMGDIPEPERNEKGEVVQDLKKVSYQVCYSSIKWGMELNGMPFHLSFAEFLNEMNQDADGYIKLILLVEKQQKHTPLTLPQSNGKAKGKGSTTKGTSKKKPTI